MPMTYISISCCQNSRHLFESKDKNELKYTTHLPLPAFNYRL